MTHIKIFIRVPYFLFLYLIPGFRVIDVGTIALFSRLIYQYYEVSLHISQFFIDVVESNYNRNNIINLSFLLYPYSRSDVSFQLTDCKGVRFQYLIPQRILPR